ncbi:MAG: glyoxalase [Xanthomonadales bacterium]|nr:glyoxalase [Xanthomonadales bacterium]
MDLAISDLRPFIPAKDFAVSKAFYEALGWVVEYEDPELALLANAERRFYLQRGYLKEWAENTMLFIPVADAVASFEAIRAVLETRRFGDARVAPPRQQPYGALVTHVWDPAGVLLHLAQWTDA